jgi:breast cancer 2 susceptibility protein
MNECSCASSLFLVKVGYCNLIKRCRDQRNCLWVAESSKSSDFTVNLSSERFSHLRKAANKVDQWFKAYGQVSNKKLNLYNVGG